MRVPRKLFLAIGAMLLFVVVLTLVLIGAKQSGESHADSAHKNAQTPAWAGLETEPVSYRELSKEIRTVGKLDYDERQVAYISARIAGRVERVFADFAGIDVEEREHLVNIYSPDLVVTVQNLLDALQSGNMALADVARDRLKLWGVLPEQIRDLEKSGKAVTHLTIFAPIGGTIIEKNVRKGQYVKEGDLLYRIANLDPIWLYLDIYEYDLGWVRFGDEVEVAVEAFPGERLRGKVIFVDPFLDDKTRTVRARVNLANADRKLKPAMYASARIHTRLRSDGTPAPTGLEGKYYCTMHPEIVRDKPGKCKICVDMPLKQIPDLRPPKQPVHDHAKHDHGGHKNDVSSAEPGKVLAIRASAVLSTGRRSIAYRQTPKGNFELIELRLGPRAEGKDDSGQRGSYYPVLDGLEAGDRVVVRGGFLLDSQRQIEGMPSLLYPEGQAGAALHGGHAPPPKSGGHKH